MNRLAFGINSKKVVKLQSFWIVFQKLLYLCAELSNAKI